MCIRVSQLPASLRHTCRDRYVISPFFFFQAEDGIRDRSPSRGLGDVYKRQLNEQLNLIKENIGTNPIVTITYFIPDDRKSGGAYISNTGVVKKINEYNHTCLLYTSPSPRDGLLSRMPSSA